MTSRRSLMPWLSTALLVVVAAACGSPSAQSPATATRTERFHKMSADAEARGLAEPFKGITTNGTPMPGLFAIRSTGVSTEPVRVAAEALLAALTAEQRAQDVVRRRRPRVAQVDEPALLRAAGRQLRGDDRGAARGGVRPAAGVAEREGAQAHARHHEAEPHAGRAEQQRLRAVRRVALPHHGDGDALGHRAVGLAARRPSRDHQLLRPRRSGRDDADLLSGPNRSSPRPASTRARRSCRTSSARGWRFSAASPTRSARRPSSRSAKDGNNNIGEAFKDNVVLDYAGVRATDLSAAQRADAAGAGRRVRRQHGRRATRG